MWNYLSKTSYRFLLLVYYICFLQGVESFLKGADLKWIPPNQFIFKTNWITKTFFLSLYVPWLPQNFQFENAWLCLTLMWENCCASGTNIFYYQPFVEAIGSNLSGVQGQICKLALFYKFFPNLSAYFFQNSKIFSIFLVMAP